METVADQEKSGTNCLQCERYKKLGDVCVVEHDKKYLWEFCRDYEPEVSLPDYRDLMSTVRKDLAAERKKIQEKKKRDRRLKKKEKIAKAAERNAKATLTTKDSRPAARTNGTRVEATLCEFPLPVRSHTAHRSKPDANSSEIKSGTRQGKLLAPVSKRNPAKAKAASKMAKSPVQANIPKTASSARATA